MSLGVRLLLVLVVEVDGSLGEQPLSCFGSPEEVIRRNNNSQDIFWKKNGVEEAQRGNSYLVPLEESLGGGNYTCHSKDGSLVNHTIVLIQEDKTKKRILVKTDQGTVLFKIANHTPTVKRPLESGTFLSTSTDASPLVRFVCLSLHVYVTFLVRRLFEVLCSKLQRGVPLLLDLAQKSCWQSSIYQSSAVSSQTAEMFFCFSLQQ